MRLNKVSSLLEVTGEETRLKILCLLEREKELSVGKVAKKLRISVALASHHLQSLKDHKILISEKKSQAVYYSINNSEFVIEFRKFLCKIKS